MPQISSMLSLGATSFPQWTQGSDPRSSKHLSGDTGHGGMDVEWPGDWLKLAWRKRPQHRHWRKRWRLWTRQIERCWIFWIEGSNMAWPSFESEAVSSEAFAFEKNGELVAKAIWHCCNSWSAAKSCNGEFRRSCSWPQQRSIWQWTDRVLSSEWHVTFYEGPHRCEPFKMTAVWLSANVYLISLQWRCHRIECAKSLKNLH